MSKHRTNIEGLCDTLNAVGIKTSILGRTEAKHNLLSRSLRATEKARRDAAKEIDRISRNAKRLTSR
jgi:hypothetical protein